LPALNQCWKEGTYIPDLVHRFYKLSLQLLARYLSWVQQLRKDAALLEAQQSAAAGAELTSATSITSTPAPVSTPPTPAVEIKSLLKPEELVYLYCDVEKLKEELPIQYFPRVREVNSHLPPDMLAFLEDGYQDSLTELGKEMTEISSVITEIVIKHCAAALLPLRGITRTYRLTNKPAPKRPSFYVPSILKPLQTFLDEKNKYISKDTRYNWIVTILSSVSQKYYEMSMELLETVHKTENFFKKYSPSKVAPAESGEMTDTDKIMRQLLLDVEEFGRQLNQYADVLNDVYSFGPYSHLLQYVSSADRCKRLHE